MVIHLGIGSTTIFAIYQRHINQYDYCTNIFTYILTYEEKIKDKTPIIFSLQIFYFVIDYLQIQINNFDVNEALRCHPIRGV